MKYLLRTINIVLGAIIGLLLPSCHTQKKIASNTPAEEQEIRQPRSRDMMVLYGIPPEVYKRLHEQDSIQNASQAKDSTTTAMPLSE